MSTTQRKIGAGEILCRSKRRRRSVSEWARTTNETPKRLTILVEGEGRKKHKKNMDNNMEEFGSNTFGNMLTSNPKLSNMVKLIKEKVKDGNDVSFQKIREFLSSSMRNLSEGDASLMTNLFEEWQQKLQSEKDIGGLEILYSLMQYIKIKKIHHFHELKNQIQCINEDIEIVSKSLQDSLGIPQSGQSSSGKAESGSSILQKKLFNDLKNKEYLVKVFPNLEGLYQYKAANNKRKMVGTYDYSMEATTSNREAYIKSLASTLCQVTKYKKLSLEAEIPGGDNFHRLSIISSIGFNSTNEYFATGGVSKKIKIYECENVLQNTSRIACPVFELNWRSKLSDLDWNHNEANVLATSDYDGMITLWDIEEGENIMEYDEHEKRAWSVCFSKIDTTLLASGSDDGTVKIYTTKQNRSVMSLETFANVCSVQYHPSSFHNIALGCADHNAYVYDLRKPVSPVSTLFGHTKAVSYVSYQKQDQLLTASTDNTLRMWNLVDGKASKVYSGHTNQKHFVGLAVQDDWISCGSETNELFVYHSSLEKPLFKYTFTGEQQNIGSDRNASPFVSATCWKPDSDLTLSASSDGHIRLLRLAK